LLDPPTLRRVTLYWEVPEPVRRPAHSFVHAVSTHLDPASGYPMLAQEDKELPGGFPIERWQPGKLYRDVYEIRLPASAEPGEYQFEVGWWRPDTGERLPPTSAAPSARFAPSPAASLLLFEPIYRPPLGAIARHDNLAQGIRLVGYQLEPVRPQPGQPLCLTLYWQCQATPGTSYTVFTHLLDVQGRMRAGHDSIPAQGARPTTRWLPGEVVADHHDLAIPADASTGQYTLEVGLYDAQTGQRLPAYDAGGTRIPDDRIVLTTVDLGP